MPSQGEIYWVNANDVDIVGHEQMKSRPYVIVSRDNINSQGHIVVGVPLTTKLKKANSYRVAIPLPLMIPAPGCQRALEDSVALTDHIRVLDQRRLSFLMGKLSSTAIGGLEAGLAYLLDIR